MRKKIFCLIFFVVFSIQNAFCIEEIILEEEKNFSDKLSDIYYGNIENEEKIPPAIRISSQDGIKFNNKIINSVKLSLIFEDTMTYNNTHKESHYLKNKISVVEPMIIFKFNDNKTKFMFDYQLLRHLDGYNNRFSEKISQFNISHKITDHQTILLGQGPRIPINYDGSRGPIQMETVLKSQIGRNYADVFSTGIRNIASYKYIDYDIGVYDSTRYMKNFGRGVDFTGFASVKPFQNREPELFKNIKIGGGYSIGKNNINYKTYSAFASYDYKKVHLKAEYTNADGYNGIKTSQKKSDGFYALASYDITPKVSVVAKYDFFMPDKKIKSINTQEYTAGITYKPYKNLKLLLNYVAKVNSKGNNSNMILFATRFIL